MVIKINGLEIEFDDNLELDIQVKEDGTRVVIKSKQQEDQKAEKIEAVPYQSPYPPPPYQPYVSPWTIPLQPPYLPQNPYTSPWQQPWITWTITSDLIPISTGSSTGWNGNPIEVQSYN